MLQGKDEAIVLRKKFNYYSLLNKSKGLFDAYLINVPMGKIISPGMRISYVLGEKHGHAVWVHDCVVEDSPLLFGRHDIVFLHALLELVVCYGTVADSYGEIYRFFEVLCSRFLYEFSPLMKKTIICALFSRLGLYPDQVDFFDYRFFLSLSIDNIDTINLELVDESFLERWILWNIDHYPQGKWIKVLPYIIEK